VGLHRRTWQESIDGIKSWGSEKSSWNEREKKCFFSVSVMVALNREGGAFETRVVFVSFA
jgi:hypothetical protein